MTLDTVSTERLLLRPWRQEDKAPFAALNGSAEVMEYFPSTMTAEESDALVDRFQAGIVERGWGVWAAERKADGAFIGFIGMGPVTFDAYFTPAVEIGWRLDKPFWGQGYATEGARACLEYAFDTLGLDRVVSFTATTNHRSEAVMNRIGMARVGTFEHPRVAEGHQLRPHVLYEVRAPSR